MQQRHLMGLLVACNIVSLACFAQKEQSVTLKLKHKQGDVSRYQTTAEITTNVPSGDPNRPIQSSYRVDITQQLKVLKLLKAGGSEIELSTLSGQYSQNGQPFQINDPAPAIITYDQRGNISAMRAKPKKKGEGLAEAIGSGALGMLRVYIPPSAVKVGEAWRQEVSIPGLRWTGKGNAYIRFLRTEPVGRYETARLRAAFALPITIYINQNLQPLPSKKGASALLSGLLSMSFDSNFAIAEGKPVKSGGSGTAKLRLKLLDQSQTPTKKRLPSALEKADITMEMHLGSNLLE